MTTYAVDRRASCRCTVHLDWSAVACPCGAVVTCDACDEVAACDECSAARDHGEDS